jgi:hypothetical protein
MKKVYQTIIDKSKGNCMQAAFASLFELELEQVPNFIELGEDWTKAFFTFLAEQGYEYNGQVHNPKALGEWGKDRMTELRELSQGVNGLYFGAVYSPRFFELGRMAEPDYKPVTHAVIVDADFNVVFDPNPAYEGITYPLAHRIGYNGVLYVDMLDPIEAA